MKWQLKNTWQSRTQYSKTESSGETTENPRDASSCSQSSALASRWKQLQSQTIAETEAWLQCLGATLYIRISNLAAWNSWKIPSTEASSKILLIKALKTERILLCHQQHPCRTDCQFCKSKFIRVTLPPSTPKLSTFLTLKKTIRRIKQRFEREIVERP